MIMGVVLSVNNRELKLCSISHDIRKTEINFYFCMNRAENNVYTFAIRNPVDGFVYTYVVGQDEEGRNMCTVPVSLFNDECNYQLQISVENTENNKVYHTNILTDRINLYTEE